MTGLVWLSQELLAASSSSGCLVLYRVGGWGCVAQDWPQLHKAGLVVAAQSWTVMGRVWLQGDRMERSINFMNVVGHSVVFGGDNEAFYVMR